MDNGIVNGEMDRRYLKRSDQTTTSQKSGAFQPILDDPSVHVVLTS